MLSIFIHIHTNIYTNIVKWFVNFWRILSFSFALSLSPFLNRVYTVHIGIEQ